MNRHNWKYIVWTGRNDYSGVICPSGSIGCAETLNGAIETAQRELARLRAIGRPLFACVITTYGAQRLIASVTEGGAA